MFDWLKRATYSDEVLTPRSRATGFTGFDSSEHLQPRARASSAGHVVVSIGLCVSTFMFPLVIPVTGSSSLESMRGAIAHVSLDAGTGEERVEIVRPEEAWLFRDPEALAGVMLGLEQAAARKFAAPPDISAALALYGEDDD